MADVRYREIPLVHSRLSKWKELLLNTGSAQSTLEVVKLPEHAGGYVYDASSLNVKRVLDRYIYWKCAQSTLELVEDSHSTTLVGNRLRIRFDQSAILDGVGIFETTSHIVILVATVGSVHQFSFKRVPLDSTKSIFADGGPESHEYYCFNIGLAQPHTSCCWLGNQGDAAFVLGTDKSLFVVNFTPFGGADRASVTELRKNSSIGFIKDMFRGKGGTEADDMPCSVVCHPMMEDFYVYSLSADLSLRVWSYKRQECVYEENVSKWIQEGGGDNSGTRSGQMPKISKCVDDQGDLLLVIFSPRHSRFILVRPILETGGIMQCYNSGLVTAQEFKLISFQVTSRSLWALFVNRQNENVMGVYPLRWEDEVVMGETERPRWNFVSWTDRLAQVPQSVSSNALDTREVFAERLFSEKLFSTETLWRALQIFSRRDNHISNVVESSGGVRLNEECLRAIEHSIKRRTRKDMSDEEFSAVVKECYECFYTFCVQYHEAGARPLGFFVDTNRDAFVGLVKSDQVSFLYMCDDFSSTVLSRLSNSGAVNCQPNVAEFIGILGSLDEELTSTLSAEFSDLLYHGASRDEIEEKSLAIINATDKSRTKAMLKADLRNISNLIAVLEELANRLYIEGIEPTDAVPVGPFSSLFRSITGTNFIASAIHQEVLLRYTFCQRLVFMTFFILKNAHDIGVPLHKTNVIESSIVPSLFVLLRCYYTQLWCCETVVQIQGESMSICELAVRSDTSALIILENEYTIEAGWAVVLQAYIGLLVRLLWPETDGGLCIPFVLMENNLYSQLQQYVRLLSEWCNKNQGTLKYLQAHSLLCCDEVYKATEFFISCYSEAIDEPYVRSQVLGNLGDERLLSVWYYLKIVKQLECRNNASDCVIKLANACLQTDPPADQLSIIYAIIFRHELLLNHVDKACFALRKNPDQDTQRDCLRQLVVVLCERNQYKTLVEFPHESLRKELLSIIEMRARATDLIGPYRYYELLYACYVYSKNYRQAAAVMYEWGFRLSREVPGIDSLQLQASCFLNSINCLTLIGAETAWIVRPGAESQRGGSSSPAPKRTASGQQKPEEEEEVNIDVLSIRDVEKQLCLVQAWVQLLQHEAKIVPPLTPHETVSYLVRYYCYNTATRVCEMHHVTMDLIFESLATLCCKDAASPLSASPGFANPEWIIDNPEVVADIPRTAWTLLEHYLDKYATSDTNYYRRVAESFFEANTSLPPWFEVLYKKKNYPELLRLYIFYSRLSDATKLSIDAINAALGNSKELFGFNESLTATSRPIWLPMSVFDQLLTILDFCDHSRASELRDQLKEKIAQYFNAAEEASSLAIRLQ